MTIKIKKQGGATKATSKVLTEIGTLGLRQSEGQIEEEWMRQLQGDRKIRALKTMETSDATAFAAVQMTNMAVKQVKFWYNAAGETDADTQAREFATECTFEDMEDHWLHYLDEWLTCVALGYSVAEQVFKIRGGPDQADPSRRSLYDDGKIGWKKFAFRPQETLADIKLDQGPTSINRYDRERQATVAADLVGTAALGDATKKIYELPVMKTLPRGVTVSPSGDAESLNELSAGFATAITAGLMMVYAVLVLLFGTFLQPITILFSLPLSIGGAIVALLVTGKPLTMPVLIGILMLMGIVTKNAIMLVEFAVE